MTSNDIVASALKRVGSASYLVSCAFDRLTSVSCIQTNTALDGRTRGEARTVTSGRDSASATHEVSRTPNGIALIGSIMCRIRTTNGVALIGSIMCRIRTTKWSQRQLCTANSHVYKYRV
jgi:hypothetical protein